MAVKGLRRLIILVRGMAAKIQEGINFCSRDFFRNEH